jgi:hypothetical protein
LTRARNDAEIEARVLEERDRQGYSKQPSSESRLWGAEAAWPAHKLGKGILMQSESRITVAAAFRKYYQEEIESMIRQMKIEGGTLDDCIAELNILANFIHSQADTLRDAWPTLLKDTACEQWEQKQNEAGITGVPMDKSDVQSFKSIGKGVTNEHG